MLGFFMDSQHLNSYKIDIFNIFIIRMLKIIFREAIKIYGSFGQGINPEYFIDEILAEAWAKCLDEGL